MNYLQKILIAGLMLFMFGVVSVAFNQTAQALTVNPRLEIDANPGQTVTTILKLINEERQTKTFYLRYENFNSQDETGNPSFSLRREDLATWITTPESITLGPGERMNLPLEIAVPFNAEPGGHYAATFFLTEPPNPNDDPGKVALSAKLGTLILLRVSGDFKQNADILEFGTTNKQHFFTQLPVQFYYRFQNTGDDHLKPIGDIQIKNIFGGNAKILEANPEQGSVLPKSIRKFFSTWTEYSGDIQQAPVVDLPKTEDLRYWDSVKYQTKHFVIGRYTANLKLAFGTKALQTDHAEFVFYIIPWQLLSIAIPVLIILLWILRRLIKRYNRYIISRAQK